jgi:signal peptidase I
MQKATTAQDNDDGFLSFLRTLVFAAAIAIVFRAFLFEPFSIPSGSMVPTLLVGDYLFVSKYTYGYSARSIGLGFLKNWFGIPLPAGRVLGGRLHRGDVVVFKLPTDNTTDYVKRLIGFPGDRIQMREGRLYINDQIMPREVSGSFQLTENDLDENRAALRRMFSLPSIQYTETLPNGKQHTILEMTDDGRLDNTGVYVVPQGHYFCMGDNRDNSQDSRVASRVGFVPEENIVGRAEFIFFSLRGGTPFWKFWEWPGALRWSRMLKGIS